MRRSGLALLLLVLLGCGKGLPAKPSSPAEAAPAGAPAISPDAAASSMEVKGVELRLYDNHPSAGEERKPTFWVHADACALQDDNLWSFDKARAIIYGRDQNQEPIRIEAARGRFQESKMAYLEGGIEAWIGAMRLHLQDIEWNNDEDVARSDNPLTIASPRLYLEASSVRLLPKTREMTLTHVSGLIQIEEGDES